jgi:hypothetical protein
VDARLKGQEISIRVVDDGQLVSQIDSIGTFNDNVKFELKEDGFLGETTNRYDEVFNGFGFDFEYQPTAATHLELTERIAARARRDVPNRTFNIVRTDFFANGQSAIVTYIDVKWGPTGTSIAGKNEFVKVKMEGGCSERTVQINAV